MKIFEMFMFLDSLKIDKVVGRKNLKNLTQNSLYIFLRKLSVIII